MSRNDCRFSLLTDASRDDRITPLFRDASRDNCRISLRRDTRRDGCITLHLREVSRDDSRCTAVEMPS